MNTSKSTLVQYLGHLLRCANQQAVTQQILDNLSEDELYIINDFKMKFLPRRFRCVYGDFVSFVRVLVLVNCTSAFHTIIFSLSLVGRP